jgi:tRNA(fMet)-specific endonuclease VapC
MTRDRRSSNAVFSLAQDVTQNIVFQSLCFRTASENDPIYEKAMQLGREYRQSLRPKTVPRRKQ